MAVHDVRVGERAAHHEVLQQGGEESRVPGVLRRQRHWRLDAGHRQVRGALVLIAEAHDLHVMARVVVERRQLAREVLDVDARAAVHVRRVFVGQDGDVHAAPG
jgi:hypothetical protein